MCDVFVWAFSMQVASCTILSQLSSWPAAPRGSAALQDQAPSDAGFFPSFGSESQVSSTCTCMPFRGLIAYSVRCDFVVSLGSTPTGYSNPDQEAGHVIPLEQNTVSKKSRRLKRLLQPLMLGNGVFFSPVVIPPRNTTSRRPWQELTTSDNPNGRNAPDPTSSDFRRYRPMMAASSFSSAASSPGRVSHSIRSVYVLFSKQRSTTIHGRKHFGSLSLQAHTTPVRR